MAGVASNPNLSGGSPKRVVDLGDADWYVKPAWYDILHAAGTAWEVDGLERMALRHCACSWSGAMRWLEPACGSGRYLRCAARRGVGVRGFDASPKMVEYARERTPRKPELGSDARYDVARFDDFPLDGPKADFAFCLINSIRHVRTDDELRAHFDRLARALKRGGVYAVGINTSGPGLETPTEDLWTGARGRCRVVQLASYLPAGNELVRTWAQRDESIPVGEEDRFEGVLSHLTIETPTTETHLDTRYLLRTYTPRQWRGVLDASGLEAFAVVDEQGESVGDFDDKCWSGDQKAGYAIWLLRPR